MQHLRYAPALAALLSSTALAQGPTTVNIVTSIPATWIDISTTGAALGLADDGEVDIPNTVTNAIVNAQSCRVGSNGALRIDGINPDLNYINTTIPAFGAFNRDRTLMPFWDDINTDNGQAGDIFWEEINGTLIVQWHDVSFYSSAGTTADTVRFQIQVHSSGPALAQFLYDDIEQPRANGGASATIGFQAGTMNFTDLEYSFNQAGIVSNGDVLSVITGTGPIGTNYCGPAVANSTGSPATMGVSGSADIANNDLVLEATDLPNSSFGFFLTSQAQGFVANPGGSSGNLCLSGAIGRYVGAGQIQNSGTSGMISLAIDNSQHPTPNGLVQVMSGDAWNFQAWYRDNSGGAPTSNFTDGIEVTFN